MVKKYLIGILRIFLYLLAVFLLGFHLFGISLNFSNINSFFINKIFAGKLSYEGISFRQSLKGIDINLENFNYDGDIKVEGQNLFLKLNLLNSFLSKEVYIDFLFFDEASIKVNPSNERRNIINFFVKEGRIKRASLGKANIESLNIANLRTEGRRFGFTFKESSISFDNTLKNISGFSGIASFENQKLKLLIDSNIALFNLDIYQEERVLSDLRGLLSLDFKDKFKILPSFLNAKTANSEQFFNINFDEALILNVLTIGDSRDIYYWAPSNLASNYSFRQSNIFSEDVKSIFSFTLLNDNRSLSGKILLSNPKVPFLKRNFDINSVEMNIDNFKIDAVANGTLPFTDSENLYLDYSFAEEVFKASFLDDFKDPFSISFDNKGSVSAINGSLKPKIGTGYHINFFDNQVFVNSDLLQLKFLFSKNLNIFADNYLFEISKIDSNLFTFEQEYPSRFNFDLSNLSVKNLNTKFYINYSNYVKENFPNLTFEKFSIETKNISANISSNSLEFFGNFLVDGEDIKYSDASFDFDALRVLSLIDLRTSFSSFLNLNFDKYERDSFYVDRLDGEMLIQGNNLINISNLELDFGPAKADINGSILTNSLLYDTYDLNLDFTTKISQALPWYVAIFGGIPAAAGTAIVTGILDDNINEITKTSYKIKGNNNNLEVLNN
ncbi:AsmA-like C-terminal region-containing protein [SAR86 cluster bacterium]|uniref:AsmA-like C-terminal region-containing protein n=1 Tax=SAR86 cluster bacterium TaxID=2030880 RepID=A0A9Q8U085_9GAMM|nr:AsmA-like C-terminal region-containing protein [SAR86 cluster bacterium]